MYILKAMMSYTFKKTEKEKKKKAYMLTWEYFDAS